MKIKLKIECKSCKGTGIYVGMGERDGAGVICRTCRGTGCQDYSFEYTPFKRRHKREDIKRVFIQGYGYCIGTKPITLDNGVYVDFSKEGVSYKEFLAGNMPKHIKHMACPMLANQSACHNIKGFVDQCERLNGGWISLISECKCKDKRSCWDRFEKGEQKYKERIF
jgi:hypothetical protein